MQPMFNWNPKRWNCKQPLVVLVCLLLVGCTDGWLHQMKSVNPYYLREWEKDRQRGTTFSERVAEIRLLQSQLGRMQAVEHQEWAEKLQRIVRSDPSAEMRALAVQTLAEIPGPVTVAALNLASTDSSEKVRLAACEAWKAVGGDAARDMLLTMAGSGKESPSVRRAATAALGAFGNDAEVKSTLASLLDDKSPALQYQAALSLKQVTGRDYGGDIQAWREFMQGQDVPEPERSLMATFWETLQWK